MHSHDFELRQAFAAVGGSRDGEGCAQRGTIGYHHGRSWQRVACEAVLCLVRLCARVCFLRAVEFAVFGHTRALTTRSLSVARLFIARRELLQTFDLSVGVDPLIRKLDTNQDGEVRFDEFADFLSKEDHELDTVLHRNGNRSIFFRASCIPRKAALRKKGRNNAPSIQFGAET